MKVSIALILSLFVVPAFAQAVEAPMVSFEQQVDIVVSAKQDPHFMDVKFHQDKENIALDAIVDKSTDAKQGKLLAFNLIMIAKAKSIMDDAPKDRNTPGKGIFNYRVVLAFPDGVTLVTATKAKDKDMLSFEDPFHMEPLTRADEVGR